MLGARALRLVLVMVLGVSACSGTSEPDAEIAGDSSTTPSIPADLPDEVASLIDSAFAEVPGGLTIEPAVVTPGEVVEVSGLESLVGSVTWYRPDGAMSEHLIDGSSVTVSVPLDAAIGLHLVVAETPDGVPVAATFRVADGPFVSLALVRGGLVVEQRGVSLDAPAAIRVGSGDDAAFLEAGAGGLLLPVSHQLTATLQDYLGLDLELPPTVDGELILVVDEGDGSSLVSNTVMLERCETDPIVVGDLGGPGEVRAVWTGSRPGSAAAHTDGGSYRLDVGPGPVAVTEYQAGADPRTSVVRARCDREHDVSMSGSSGEGFAAESLAEDSWVGMVSGADELTIDDGVVICTADGDGMEISLFDELDFSIGLVATLDGFDRIGSYEVSGFVLTAADGFADGWFRFEIGEATDGMLAGTFSGDATLESGDIEFVGAFRCAIENLGGFGGSGGSVGVFASYQSRSDHEPCRVGLVATNGPGAEVARVLARRLASGNPLIEWYTSDDVAGMLAVAAEDQRAGGDGSAGIEAAQRVISGDYYVPVTIREFPGATGDRRWWAILKAFDVERGVVVARAVSSGPTPESLLIIPNSGAFIEAVGRSGICGYVSPIESTVAQGETQRLSYEVVDLIDVPVFDAQVSVADWEDGRFSPDCGTLDPLVGTSGDVFETTFTAAEEVEQDCSEFPRFSATSGDRETRAEREQGSATVHVGSKWEYEVTLVVHGPDGDLTWRSGSSGDPGFFYVRESGAIVGGGSATVDGIGSCEVYENGVLTYKQPPTAVSGAWLSYLSGALVDGEYFEFRFDGRAWESSWPAIPDECLGLAWQSIDERLVRLIGYRLDIVTVNPVRLTPEATTATFAVDPEAFPDAEFVMTIRPVVKDDGG